MRYINGAGFVVEKVLNKIAHIITWNQVIKLNPDDYIMLDVRTDPETQRVKAAEIDNM